MRCSSNLALELFGAKVDFEFEAGSNLLQVVSISVWPEVVFYHQSGVLGHLCGVEILAVVFSLKRVTFQF